MHDPQPSSLGPCDVVAAWLVCLALIAVVFIYPLLAAELHQTAPQALAAIPHPAVCAKGPLPPRLPHG